MLLLVTCITYDKHVLYILLPILAWMSWIVSRRDFVTAWPRRLSILKLFVFAGKIRNAITVLSDFAACKIMKQINNLNWRAEKKINKHKMHFKLQNILNFIISYIKKSSMNVVQAINWHRDNFNYFDLLIQLTIRTLFGLNIQKNDSQPIWSGQFLYVFNHDKILTQISDLKDSKMTSLKISMLTCYTWCIHVYVPSCKCMCMMSANEYVWWWHPNDARVLYSGIYASDLYYRVMK